MRYDSTAAEEHNLYGLELAYKRSIIIDKIQFWVFK